MFYILLSHKSLVMTTFFIHLTFDCNILFLHYELRNSTPVLWSGYKWWVAHESHIWGLPLM